MSLEPLLKTKRIIVCAGTGGVGKTSVSAAIGVGAAQRGKRVLVLTIDPSRRLAEALGVQKNTPRPVPLEGEAAREAGIRPPGSLAVWVLDPKRVADETVRRLARSPESAERLLANRVYRQVTNLIAGMQEYTAMEALHGFVQEGVYDLVVLDTPPSRNALNFLEAPRRLKESVDSRILDLLAPRQGKKGTTRRFIERVLSGVFGEAFFADLQVFFGAFGGMIAHLTGNAQAMRARLAEPDAAFILVGVGGEASLAQARDFESRIRELGLPLEAIVLNRSLVPLARRPYVAPVDEDRFPVLHRAITKLLVLARKEAQAIDRAVQEAEALAERSEVPVIAVRELGQGVDDLPGLARVAEWLFEGESAAPAASTDRDVSRHDDTTEDGASRLRVAEPVP